MKRATKRSSVHLVQLRLHLERARDVGIRQEKHDQGDMGNIVFGEGNWTSAHDIENKNT